MTEVINHDNFYWITGLIGLFGLFGLINGAGRCRHCYGEIKEGYQTCSLCGKKITVEHAKCDHKWGEIKECYQTCTICGEVKQIPCNHKWSIIEKETYARGNVFTSRCFICGELSTHSTLEY